jgi:tryptophan-rich sensory protein
MIDPMSLPKQIIGLVILVLLCLGAAAVGSAATVPRIEGWYAALAKPSWTPPNWIFGPVWTVLYIAMAVAAWLVWRQKGWSGTQVPLLLFAAQLALNVAWSWLFFGMKSPGLGFVDILLLWIAIAATLVAFWSRSMVAGLLLVPYLAWVTFAAALNYSIWQLNTEPHQLANAGTPGTTPSSPLGESAFGNVVSRDDGFRELVVGTWQDEYQGKRTLTLRKDGTGTMVVELSGLQAALVAPRLTFNMEWSIADGRLEKRSIDGEPAAQVSMILATMGDTVNEKILELTEEGMLLLDQDGKTEYDWRRVQ